MIQFDGQIYKSLHCPSSLTFLKYAWLDIPLLWGYI